MNTYSYIRRNLLISLAAVTVAGAPAAAQQAQKPNIVVIMGDDIGYWNISAYNRGQMGYRTPNLDRIANEGAIFTELLRAAILHRRSGGVHHRPEPHVHRPSESRSARRQGRPVGQRPDPVRAPQAFAV